ncbi:MAG: Wzz/FepE/Etk N-terminal domain-containing protein [Sphingomonas sp.]
MSFIQFFRILWARKLIVIGTTLVCFLAALVSSYVLPERYEARSRVMMDLIQPDPVTGQSISSAFARAYTRTQTQLIKDYRVTGAVVDALGWTSSPELLARFNSVPHENNIDFRRWLAQIVSAGTTANAIEASNILEITYTSINPQTARVIADAVRDAYVGQNLAFKRETAAKSAVWFDRQAASVREQLAAAEARKTAYERANRIVLQDDQSDSESTRLKALSGQVASASAAAAMAGGSPAALQLAQLDARIASTAETLGPNHPELQALREQRAAVARASAQERAAMQVGGPVGPSIDSQVAAAESRVIAQRGKVEEARRLQTDVIVLRDQYAKTTAKAAEYRQQAQSNESGLTLLGSAVAPEQPVFPNMPLIIFGSIGAGLALGVLAALITEMLSRRVRGIEDLTGTGVPVLVVVRNGGAGRRSQAPLLERLRLRAPEPA